MRKLPSLTSLRAFEAAARHASFTVAADELHVTQTAVSRSVKVLEAQLGCRLFERHANSLALTDQGRILLPELTTAFDLLASAAQRTQTASARPVLTVGVGPTFAMRWLIPRLGRFQQLHPGIEVHTTTGGVRATLRREWSCSISLGRDEAPGVTSVALFSPDIFPVCHPRVARKLRTPRDLYKATVLEVGHSPGDWSAWLARAKLDEAAIARRLVFEYYAFALQAALDGVGVAMGLHPYVVDDLAAGRLVAPFRLVVAKPQGWHLAWRAESRDDPALAAFVQWVRAEARSATAAGLN